MSFKLKERAPYSRSPTAVKRKNRWILAQSLPVIQQDKGSKKG